MSTELAMSSFERPYGKGRQYFERIVFFLDFRKGSERIRPQQRKVETVIGTVDDSRAGLSPTISAPRLLVTLCMCLAGVGALGAVSKIHIIIAVQIAAQHSVTFGAGYHHGKGDAHVGARDGKIRTGDLHLLRMHNGPF